MLTLGFTKTYCCLHITELLRVALQYAYLWHNVDLFIGIGDIWHAFDCIDHEFFLSAMDDVGCPPSVSFAILRELSGLTMKFLADPRVQGRRNANVTSHLVRAHVKELVVEQLVAAPPKNPISVAPLDHLRRVLIQDLPHDCTQKEFEPKKS